MSRNYLVRRIPDLQGVPCPCGTSTRAITRKDTDIANVHVTQIFEAKKHFHKRCTEIYYVLEGQGRMEVGDDVFDVSPGTVVMIPAGMPHAGRGNFKILLVGVPALEPDDEYLLEA
ncbi:MAG: cupin domain-containing protein [Planctomycetes bacterium]|nr:cupin domain-containing protein [Planctomycetota bacterium]